MTYSLLFAGIGPSFDPFSIPIRAWSENFRVFERRLEFFNQIKITQAWKPIFLDGAHDHCVLIARSDQLMDYESSCSGIGGGK